MLLATILTGSATAQTALRKPNCSAATITILEEKVAEMRDGRQKDTASTEVASAKVRLNQGQIDECQDHLLKASVQMK